MSIPRVTIETTTKTVMDLDMEAAARWFANLTDEQQADFFVAVARASQEWQPAAGNWSTQYWFVGRHLRDCACSTDDARDLVRELGRGLAS